MISEDHRNAQKRVIRAEQRVQLAELAIKQRRRYRWQMTTLYVLAAAAIICLLFLRLPLLATALMVLGAFLTIGNASGRAGLPSAADLEREHLVATSELAVAKQDLTHIILKGHPDHA